MYKNILIFMPIPMLLVLLQNMNHAQRFPIKLEKLYSEINKTKKLKYILFWSNKVSFNWHEEGQKLFIMNNCKIDTCFLTTNSNIFNGNLSDFDAILFYGPHMKYLGDNLKLPKQRYSHQKYVYVSKESAENYPECTPKFNGFYNWTATYRLDSDIQLRYITVRDMHGNIVAPRKQPNWLKSDAVYNHTHLNITNTRINITNSHNNTKIMDEIMTKTKAAAWFVSQCKTPIYRENFVNILQNELKEYNLTVDTYGKCGPLKCGKTEDGCDLMIKRDYFFYLAFENTFSRDYITEKVFHGYRNRVVPIVYGGADYNRFLPPGSYIDASNMTIRMLAATMDYLIHNPQEYAKYFWWLPFYQMYDGDTLNFSEASCDLCALLHDEEKFNNQSTYNDFRNWWSPNHKTDCARLEEETVMSKIWDIPIRKLFSDIYLTARRRFYIFEEEASVHIPFDKFIEQSNPEKEDSDTNKNKQVIEDDDTNDFSFYNIYKMMNA